MRSVQSMVVVTILLLCSQALASAAGPFPQIQLVDAACQRAYAVPPNGPLRITYQDVAQSCAGQRCHVIYDKPIDASEMKLEWAADPQGGERTPLAGTFVKSKEMCEGRPVWTFQGKMPEKGGILFVSPRTSYGYIYIQEDKPAGQPTSE